MFKPAPAPINPSNAANAENGAMQFANNSQQGKQQA